MSNHPLRLSVGSHQAGSGQGCAMNVISWENGDSRITDMPACTDPLLARIVQRVNDTICTHRDGDLLCPPCSVEVLALAHRTVGTGLPADATEEQRRDRQRVWVRVAVDQARQVLHLMPKRESAEAAIRTAEAWADDPSEKNRATAAVAYHYAYDTGAAYLLATAAFAPASYAYASYVYADAIVYGGVDDLALAHRVVDVFMQHTGHTEQQPDPETVATAYARMTETR